MKFLDINTFYSPRGGGIRTYHQAKLAWFERHGQHSYCLVCPGPRRGERQLARNVQIAEVWGPSVGQGYRLMADYRAVYRLIQSLRPDVVEIGDAVPSGLLYWLTRRLWRCSDSTKTPLVTSFYHSDLIRTSVAPWAEEPGVLRPLRRIAGRVASGLFYRHQRAYDLTIATSRAMQSHLSEHGIARTERLPLGVDPIFLDGAKPPRRATDSVRLIYAGRLGKEKGIELLLAILPRLLEMPNVQLTVVGKGTHEAALAAIEHPRYAFRPFVSSRAEMAELYRQHDILLAPGPFETFGLGVLEALASGLVVVGPNAGGTGELLGQLDPAFRFAAHDSKHFYAATCRAIACNLNDEAARSRAVAESYGTWDDAIGRMVEFYTSFSGVKRPDSRFVGRGPHRRRLGSPVDIELAR